MFIIKLFQGTYKTYYYYILLLLLLLLDIVRYIMFHWSNLLPCSYLFVKDLMLCQVVIMNALSHCLQSRKGCHKNTNSSLNDLINDDE